MSNNLQGLTSYDIQPGPFSEDELREQWNAQADVDELNHWDNLGLDEQLAWAQTRAIAADRAQGAPRDRPPSVAAADRPRYLRQTLNGWEAADHRDGPWRPFSAPQAVPPFPVVEALAVEADPHCAAAEAPLWRVLQDVYYSVTQQPDVFSEEHERLTIAAEIRAVQDWLVPEDGPRPGISWPMERAAWDARQSIRATLTTEADRAERGE